MEVKSYQKFDGSMTTDVDKYCQSYHDAAMPFEAIGWRLIGFDPNLTFADSNDKTVSLSYAQVDDLMWLNRNE